MVDPAVIDPAFDKNVVIKMFAKLRKVGRLVFDGQLMNIVPSGAGHVHGNQKPHHSSPSILKNFTRSVGQAYPVSC